VQADPVRIVEAVITGVSFLGAGTIIRNREEGDIQGLTTVASLLFAAALGIGVALGQWILSFGAVILVLITCGCCRYWPTGFSSLNRPTKE
jgi:putative Mg2+ transporter-C (MgtC) family protein